MSIPEKEKGIESLERKVEFDIGIGHYKVEIYSFEGKVIEMELVGPKHADMRFYNKNIDSKDGFRVKIDNSNHDLVARLLNYVKDGKPVSISGKKTYKIPRGLFRLTDVSTLYSLLHFTHEGVIKLDGEEHRFYSRPGHFTII